MSNTNVSLLLGTVVAFAGGFLTARHALKREYEERLLREVQMAQDFYDNMYTPGSQGDRIKVVATVPNEYHNTKADIRPKELVPVLNRGPDKNNPRDYVKYGGEHDRHDPISILAKDDAIESTNDNEEENVEEEFGFMVEGKPYNFDTDTLFYVIDSEEFYNAETTCEQTSLTYYTKDDTLADENDTLIDAPTDIIGREAYDILSNVNERGPIYVRNHMLMMEYEIIKETRSFSEVVLGIFPT